MDAKEQAIILKHSGYNCAQAVMCALKDHTDLTEEQLKQIGAGFAVGMGNMENTCGALIGAEIMLGLTRYEGRPIITLARGVNEEFADMCGALLCKDLKGRDTGTVICDCDTCIRNAVEIAEKYL